MMEALSECMQEHCSIMFEVFLQNKSVKSIIHESILDSYGLLQKQEEVDEDGENEEEIARHNEEIQKIKKEKEYEMIEENNKFSKGRFKTLVMMIQSDGWFEEDDDEE